MNKNPLCLIVFRNIHFWCLFYIIFSNNCIVYGNSFIYIKFCKDETILYLSSIVFNYFLFIKICIYIYMFAIYLLLLLCILVKGMMNEQHLYSKLSVTWFFYFRITLFDYAVLNILNSIVSAILNTNVLNIKSLNY